MKREDFNIVFLGTPEFAVESLKTLFYAGYNIVAVVTATDKPAGRGKKLKQSEIKKVALQYGLNVLQPLNLKDEKFIIELKKAQPHLGVVVAFRMLPEKVWDLPVYGTINLHASLLPQYRGAAPINHVLINGEKETGLTTFFLDKNIDTGKIILQKKLTIGANEYLDSLYNRMKTAGAKLLLETVDTIRERKTREIPQNLLINNNEKLKLAPKIFKNDCKIKWYNSTLKIYNMIRGLSPYPASYSTLISPEGKKFSIKIYNVKYETIKHNLKPGNIITNSKNMLKVAAGDGFIQIMELQISGRKRMPIDVFLRGFSINNNWNFIDND